MALIVEDGTGKLDAEAYISVVEADDYHAKFGNTVWAPLPLADKEIALRVAASYMVQTFRGQWQGYRTIHNQALDFPRRSVFRDDYDLIDFNIVPYEVKQGNAELALTAHAQSLQPATQTRSKKRIKIANIEIEYDGSGAQATVFINAVRRLAVFLNSSSGGMTSTLERC